MTIKKFILQQSTKKTKIPIEKRPFFSYTAFMSAKYPKDLLLLINYLKKLPGVGLRTAERFAFEFLTWPVENLEQLGSLLTEISHKIPTCQECGCLTDQGTCSFCHESRDTSALCILSSARDAYAIEETKAYRGLYHVIEHLLSPLDGRHAEQLRICRITERIIKHSTQEVIIALDSTLEGDTTSLYLKNELDKLPLRISRLSVGLPMGSSLEYIDGNTLARALMGRQTL
ncbi:MAG: recombination mediator RecR [Chlamydiales bacterium]|nr:recombination mediator RecR [Chlamydiales bacterium]